MLNAGAAPLPRPLHRHTWQTFSRNWEVDVQHAFGWTREALLHPLEPGSTVIALSSGAALSRLTAERRLCRGQGHHPVHDRAMPPTSRSAAALGIRFLSVLPQLTPATDLGAAAVAAYAARQGVDVATFLEGLGPALTPDQAGEAVAAWPQTLAATRAHTCSPPPGSARCRAELEELRCHR